MTWRSLRGQVGIQQLPVGVKGLPKRGQAVAMCASGSARIIDKRTPATAGWHGPTRRPACPVRPMEGDKRGESKTPVQGGNGAKPVSLAAT